MLCSRVWTESRPRVELDNRARDSRLHLERLQRLFLPVAETAPAKIIPFDRPRSGRTRAPAPLYRPTGAREAGVVKVRQGRSA